MKLFYERIIILMTIVAFAGLFLFWKSICNKSESETIIKTDTVRHTIFKDSLIHDTIIYSDVKIINDTVYLNDVIIQKDTVFIYLNDYLSKKFYADTIINDSTGFIAVYDTIFRNLIHTRRSDIMLYNTTKTIQDNNKHFFFGAGTAINDSITFNANFYYQKNKSIYGIGINTDKQILFNYIYKLK